MRFKALAVTQRGNHPQLSLVIPTECPHNSVDKFVIRSLHGLYATSISPNLAVARDTVNLQAVAPFLREGCDVGDQIWSPHRAKWAGDRPFFMREGLESAES